MSPERRRLLARVHVQAKQLGLDDEAYRAALRQWTGKDSAGALSDAQLRAVIAALEARGAPKFRRGPSKKAHVRKVFALWGELRRRDLVRVHSPRGFVARMAGVDDPEFMTAAQARPVIEALKAWLARGGDESARSDDGASGDGA